MRPSKYVRGARRLRCVAAPAATLVTLSSAGLVVVLAGSAQASTAVPPAASAQTPAAPVAVPSAGKAAVTVPVVFVPVRDPAPAPRPTPAALAGLRCPLR